MYLDMDFNKLNTEKFINSIIICGWKKVLKEVIHTFFTHKSTFYIVNNKKANIKRLNQFHKS